MDIPVDPQATPVDPQATPVDPQATPVDPASSNYITSNIPIQPLSMFNYSSNVLPFAPVMEPIIPIEPEESKHYCRMCVNQFKNNFTTIINTLSTPHVDSTGTYPGSVGFNITCNSNQRKNYFQYHPTDEIITNSSQNELVDVAWSNLSRKINTWALSIINSNVIIGSTYIPECEFPQSTNINLETFNANYVANIMNIYTYPTNSPNCWLVNFNIKNINNNEFININSQVLVPTFTDVKDDIVIINEAWNNIKNQVGDWAYSKLGVSNLINTIYVPAAM